MKLLLSAVVALSCVGTALAADLPVKQGSVYPPYHNYGAVAPVPYYGVTPVVVAPPPVSIGFDWPWITHPVNPFHDPLGWAVGFVPRVQF